MMIPVAMAGLSCNHLNFLLPLCIYNHSKQRDNVGVALTKSNHAVSGQQDYAHAMASVQCLINNQFLTHNIICLRMRLVYARACTVLYVPID